MRLPRVALSVVCCALLATALAACGGGDDGGSATDLDNIPTATMPAELPTPLVVGDTIAQPPGGGDTYVIRSGDTLATIADRFGVTLEDLLEANPGLDPRALTVGQAVRLPGDAGDIGATVTPEATPDEPAATEAPPTEVAATDTPLPADTEIPGPTNTPSSLGQTYIVNEGDIPVTIAAQFGITVEALLAANPGLDPTGLNIGDVLIIPPAPPPPPEGG